MKIVFFNIPAYGHTNPTLNVVKELTSRGHKVYYFSYDIMKEKIEDAGAEFISCMEYDKELKLKESDRERIGKDLTFSTQVLVDTTLALDEMVMSEMKRIKPDCIVADSMAIWGKAAALKLGIPFVSSTTTFAFNKHSAQIMKKSGKDLISMMFSMIGAGKQVKRLQKKGYPFKNVLDIISNDNSVDTVVYTSKEFQPCSETFSDKYEFVGPSIRKAEKPFDKKKEILIYISMGTVNNAKAEFYHKCIDALKKFDAQVVISVGNLVDMNKFSDLPENISVYEKTDQIAILEKADLFITHCGMNSVNEGLYFGVPLIMNPQTDEQMGVATRTNQLGAGIFLEDENSESIFNAVKEVLDNSSYRENAVKISDNFKRCGGAKAAADKIISVCK